VVSGFVRIVTDPRMYERSTTTGHALSFVDALVESPSATWIPSDEPIWERHGQLVGEEAAIKGKLVAHAYLAAVAIVNGARLATATGGSPTSRGWPGLTQQNPRFPSQARGDAVAIRAVRTPELVDAERLDPTDVPR
jgi:hypothetical protein